MAVITPKHIAQQIIRLAEAGDQSRDSQLTERDVILLVKQISNEVMKEEMYSMRQDVDGERTIPAQFIKTSNVPVKKREYDGVNFIELPNNYASLPNNEGVRRIAPVKTGNPYNTKAMIPVQHEQMDIYAGILGQMQKQWVYFVEGNKVFFHKRCGKTLCEDDIKNVKVSLVVVDADLDDNSPISLAPELQIKVIRNVLDLLRLTYGLSDVKDMLNDNNPDTQ